MDPYPAIEYSCAAQCQEHLYEDAAFQPGFLTALNPTLEAQEAYAPAPTVGLSPPLHWDFYIPNAYGTESSTTDTQISVPEDALTSYGSQQEPGYISSPPIRLSKPPLAFPAPSELLISTGEDSRSAGNATEDTASAHSGTRHGTRMHTIAQSIGFVPTDPDTITTHDKKRQYLECIEQYVQYLHQQFELLGETPPALKKEVSHQLTNRSLRTVLVHMMHLAKQMHEQTVSEEKRFVQLRSEVHAKEASHDTFDATNP